jgi:SAM-dependent methyltransferase
MHLNSKLLFRKYALGCFQPGTRVLELAPDSQPSTYQREVPYATNWVTADLQSEMEATGQRRWGGGGVTLCMQSEYEIPSEDGAFDVVLSGQVIEHVRRPWVWMAELARVCSQGGRVITVNPVSWPYHEAPVDCWRLYPEAMRTISAEAGLVVELSVFESVEPQPRRSFPGASDPTLVGTARGAILKDALKRWAGWPSPVAYDTITIARKPEIRPGAVR